MAAAGRRRGLVMFLVFDRTSGKQALLSRYCNSFLKTITGFSNVFLLFFNNRTFVLKQHDFCGNIICIHFRNNGVKTVFVLS